VEVVVKGAGVCFEGPGGYSSADAKEIPHRVQRQKLSDPAHGTRRLRPRHDAAGIAGAHWLFQVIVCPLSSIDRLPLASVIVSRKRGRSKPESQPTESPHGLSLDTSETLRALPVDYCRRRLLGEMLARPHQLSNSSTVRNMVV
jgi:hypothetical protein